MIRKSQIYSAGPSYRLSKTVISKHDSSKNVPPMGQADTFDLFLDSGRVLLIFEQIFHRTVYPFSYAR